MFKSDERKKVTCITHNMQNFQNVNSRKVIRIEHIQTQQEYLNKPSNLEKSLGLLWLTSSTNQTELTN